MGKRPQKFEDAIRRLEEIIINLEEGEVSLEESLKVFEEGETLIKFCLARLDEAEKKIQKLEPDQNGDLKESPFAS